MQETQEMGIWFPGWQDLLEKEIATHPSFLAWRIPWTAEPGGISPWDHKESDMTEHWACPTLIYFTSELKYRWFSLFIVVIFYEITMHVELVNTEWTIAPGVSAKFSSVEFSSVAQSCPPLCDPMNCSMPGLPVHHQLPEFTQTHVHQVSDAIQPAHPLSSPSPPAPNPSQHQGLFQWVNSSHEVAKVFEFQLQHQSIQWTPRTDLL